MVTVEMREDDVVDFFHANAHVCHLIGLVQDFRKAIGAIDQGEASTRIDNKARMVMDLCEIITHTENLNLESHSDIIR